jgi:eukaryotic-like serine/threonine-protein kinase
LYLGDGRYITRRELGRGTIGFVYEAEDTVLARTVAVKTIELVFDPGEKARSGFEQRFFTEARVAARLSHPGIVVCHDVGKDPASGKLFIVFEYLKGRTLADRAAEGPMDWREALGVVVQVARAIHDAHEHGIVHRDLKPANIMLLDAGASGAAAARAPAAVKIMDFGVARLESLGPRLTRTGQSFGTPLYMSPEQALGQATPRPSCLRQHAAGGPLRQEWQPAVRLDLLSEPMRAIGCRAKPATAFPTTYVNRNADSGADRAFWPSR